MHCDNVSLNANKTTLDMYLNEKSYDCTFLLENAAPDEKKVNGLNFRKVFLHYILCYIIYFFLFVKYLVH